MESGNSIVAMTHTCAVVCFSYRYLHFFGVDACCYECAIIWFIMSTHLSSICSFLLVKNICALVDVPIAMPFCSIWND